MHGHPAPFSEINFYVLKQQKNDIFKFQLIGLLCPLYPFPNISSQIVSNSFLGRSRSSNNFSESFQNHYKSFFDLSGSSSIVQIIRNCSFLVLDEPSFFSKLFQNRFCIVVGQLATFRVVPKQSQIIPIRNNDS